MASEFKKLSVIGLGYVGLPTAAVFASRGLDVLGVDIRPDVVDLINRGKIHIVEPGGSTHGTIQHDGEEIGYVIQGEFELTVDGETFSLKKGDSFFFSSRLPHGYRNPGKTQSRIVWVNTPSTF